MSEKRTCRFCKEKMVYGSQTEILCNSIIINDKHIIKTIQYEQFGWRCPMKDDNCDIVFDIKDYNVNKLKSKEAEEKLSDLLEKEKTKSSQQL